MSEPGYQLHAESLASKWGFGDGDGLQEYLYDLPDGMLASQPERNVFLAAVVREYLLPELARRGIQVELTVTGSNHNPVRADSVNGEDIDHANPASGPEVLRGISVVVPREQVVALAARLSRRMGV